MLDASFQRGSVSGKVPADVAGAGGAENRVGRRVAGDVGVGMPERAALGRDRHAAEDQRPPLDEPVQVVAGADASGADGALAARGVEIVGRRDLHVRRVALDDVHVVARLLREHRFVGRLDAARRGRRRRASTARRNACGVCAR